MTRSLESQIADVEEQLEKLRQEKRKQDEYRSKLTPAQRLADAIHDATCRMAHEDQCGWEYESWLPGPNYYLDPKWRGYSTKKRYMEKAERILKTVDVDSALKTIALMSDTY